MQENLLKEIVSGLKLSNELNYNILMSKVIESQDIQEEHKKLLFLLLQHRDRNYLRINHNDLCFENIKAYLAALRPLELDLSSLSRIGGKEDGGYVMLTPPPPQ